MSGVIGTFSLRFFESDLRLPFTPLWSPVRYFIGQRNEGYRSISTQTADIAEAGMAPLAAAAPRTHHSEPPLVGVAYTILLIVLDRRIPFVILYFTISCIRLLQPRSVRVILLRAYVIHRPRDDITAAPMKAALIFKTMIRYHVKMSPCCIPIESYRVFLMLTSKISTVQICWTNKPVI